MLMHLREIAATRAESPIAQSRTDGPPTEAGLPALTRIAGRFTIERRLGQGGMGSVYLAYDHELGDRVALKIVHAGDASLDARFEREARTLESLTHPGIVKHVTHGVTDEGTWFLATEVLAGRTLREILRAGPIDAASAAWLGARVGTVLAYLHASGLVHRDLTPSNIFCCEDGTVRLIDFGLTFVTGGAHTLTGQGGVVGTMGFMAPEQARGEPIDGRADLFSLGCVLVSCLTGRPPFGSAVAELLINLDRDTDPTRECPPELPEGMRDVLRSLMARDRARRPASGLDAARRLAVFQGAAPLGGPPRVTLAGRAFHPPAVAFRWTAASGPMLTVVAKLTFELRPATCTLAAFQDEIALGDRHVAGDRSRPVLVTSDDAPFKPASDVLVVGHAYAPEGKPVQAVSVRVRVGAVDKTLEVTGPRTVSRDGRLGAARPATRFALTWERAARGPGGENPAGVEVAPGESRFAPSIGPEGGSRSDAGVVTAAGFGPIAPRWPERLGALGSADSPWLDAVPADQPFGAPSSPFFFNAAPGDQRAQASFADDERIDIENLDPRYPVLSTRLPGIRPHVVLKVANETRDVQLRADTLAIDTDRGTCTVTWRGQVQPPDGGFQLESELQTPDGRLAAPAPPALTPDALMAYTISAAAPAAAPALPFTPTPPSAPSPSAPSPSAPRPSAPGPSARAVAKTQAVVAPRNVEIRGENTRRGSFSAVERLWTAPGAAVEPERLLTTESWSDTELDSLVQGALARAAPAPLVTLAGQLTFPWSDAERLVVLHAFAQGSAPSPRDEPSLAALLARTAKTLSADWVPGHVARELADAIERLIAPAGVERTAIERALVERRAYQRRNLLGGDHVRGLLAITGLTAPLPCYVPIEAAASMPLSPSFAARVFGELRRQQDDLEAHPLCLRALAVGRT